MLSDFILSSHSFFFYMFFLSIYRQEGVAGLVMLSPTHTDVQA